MKKQFCNIIKNNLIWKKMSMYCAMHKNMIMLSDKMVHGACQAEIIFHPKTSEKPNEQIFVRDYPFWSSCISFKIRMRFTEHNNVNPLKRKQHVDNQKGTNRHLLARECPVQAVKFIHYVFIFGLWYGHINSFLSVRVENFPLNCLC